MAGRADVDHHVRLSELDELRTPLTRDDRLRVRDRVDRHVTGAAEAHKPGMAGADEQRLLLRAVIRRGVREDDVPDSEAAEPLEVRGTGEWLVVENLVLREVVLAEPAPRERDTGPREIDRRPVTG